MPADAHVDTHIHTDGHPQGQAPAPAPVPAYAITDTDDCQPLPGTCPFPPTTDGANPLVVGAYHPSPSAHSRAQALPLPIPPSSLQPQPELGIPSITYTLPTPVHGSVVPFPSSPVPVYNSLPSSPPKYAALPSSSEGTVLLAPPPNFYAATCPLSLSHPTSQDVDVEGGQGQNHFLIVPGHSCPHCFHVHPQHQLEDRTGRTGARGDRGGHDWMICLLVVLNVIVWSAVLYGYYCEWTGGHFDWVTPGITPVRGTEGSPGLLGGLDAAEVGSGKGGWTTECVGRGIARICTAGEDCRWAFADC